MYSYHATGEFERHVFGGLCRVTVGEIFQKSEGETMASAADFREIRCFRGYRYPYQLARGVGIQHLLEEAFMRDFLR